MSWEIIGGLGSLAGSIINGISQATTNQTNQEIANRTNRSNERINESQLAAQRENWKREQENFMLQRQWQLADREYNTPEAMKQRYLNAGINPYLAMYGGAGMQGAASENHPNAPSFSSPTTPIPMQSGAPMQPIDFSMLGHGISVAAEMYYRDRAEERSDYQLANDINVSNMNAKAALMNAASKAKEVGLSSKWIDSQIEDASRHYFLEQDKFKAENEWRDMQHALDKQRIDNENRELQIKEAALANDIRFSSAQIAQIAQMINESKQRVDNMAAEQDLSYKEYQIALNKALFDMKAELLRIGISNEQLKSQKFKDFFGTIASSLLTGAGIYYGLRGARAVSTGKSVSNYGKGRAPFKMEPYDPVKDTPWNSW